MFLIVCLVASILLLSAILCGYLFKLKNFNCTTRECNYLHSKTNVLFCFAHPDDEVMFFSPTVMSLTKGSSKNRIFLLCLSTGNYDGLGGIRREELFKSAQQLGVSPENVIILDHIELQDGPKEIWKDSVIAEVVLEVVKEKHIGAIITFDDHGVSGHPNHIAVYHGVRHLMTSTELPEGLSAYQLESVSIFRKYTSFLDLLVSATTSKVLFVSNWTQCLQAIRAMQQHKSQWVWFRRLYVIFSRYMLINTLRPIDTVTEEESKKEL